MLYVLNNPLELEYDPYYNKFYTIAFMKNIQELLKLSSKELKK